MIKEQGRVVAVEADGLWVETANQSACSRCAARKGCGQSLLVQVDGHRSYIKAALRDLAAEQFHEGDFVTIGVHESAVTRGSLLVYCLPLVGLIAGAYVGDALQMVEAAVVGCAAFGLSMAAFGVRWFSRNHSNDERFQPVVIGTASSSREQGSFHGQAVAHVIQMPDDATVK